MVRDDAFLTEPRFPFGSFNREDAHVPYPGVVPAELELLSRSQPAMFLA